MDFEREGFVVRGKAAKTGKQEKKNEPKKIDTTSELILCMITRAHFLTIIWAGYLSTEGGAFGVTGYEHTAGRARV